MLDASFSRESSLKIYLKIHLVPRQFLINVFPRKRRLERKNSHSTFTVYFCADTKLKYTLQTRFRNFILSSRLVFSRFVESSPIQLRRQLWDIPLYIYIYKIEHATYTDKAEFNPLSRLNKICYARVEFYKFESDRTARS